jgi:hypothetical protein
MQAIVCSVLDIMVYLKTLSAHKWNLLWYEVWKLRRTKVLLNNVAHKEYPILDLP